MEILETIERKMNKIQRKEREYLHTFSDTTVACSLYSNNGQSICWYYMRCKDIIRAFEK